LDITVGSKPFFAVGFWTDSGILVVMGVNIIAGSYKPLLMWTGSDVVSRKAQKCIEKIENFLIPGEAPLDSHTVTRCKKQVTWLFAWKTNALQPSILKLLTSCFASSTPNHSTCKLFVSIWDFRPTHFMFICFWNEYLGP
jgi:hypothetical protein